MLETLSKLPWYFQTLIVLVLSLILSDMGIFILKRVLPLIYDGFFELFEERKYQMIGKYLIAGGIFLFLMWGISQV